DRFRIVTDPDGVEELTVAHPFEALAVDPLGLPGVEHAAEVALHHRVGFQRNGQGQVRVGVRAQFHAHTYSLSAGSTWASVSLCGPPGRSAQRPNARMTPSTISVTTARANANANCRAFARRAADSSSASAGSGGRSAVTACSSGWVTARSTWATRSPNSS